MSRTCVRPAALLRRGSNLLLCAALNSPLLSQFRAVALRINDYPRIILSVLQTELPCALGY